MQSYAFRYLFLFCALCWVFLSPSYAQVIKPTLLKGTVSIKGTARHSFTSLTTVENQIYRLSYPKDPTLFKRKYQGQLVQLEGVIVKKALGPGFPAVFEIKKFKILD